MLDRMRRTTNGVMRNENGTTLVELLVTFALIGIFMAAATAMLTSSLRLFERMQTTSSAITVSDLILDKVAGEITAADLPESEGDKGYYFWLEPRESSVNGKTTAEERSRWVVFRNRSGSPIGIFAGESGNPPQEDMGKGQLYIKYYAVSKEGEKAVDEIDWHFDKNVYMGYEITELSFEQEDAENHPNVVTINLTIKNNRTEFEYQSKRYAECYNYNAPVMLARDDGKADFPKKAEEFEINPPGGGGEPDGPPEPNDEVDYTVRYLENKTNRKLWPDTKGKALAGKKIHIDPPTIEGYLYDEVASVKNEEGYVFTEESARNEIILYYGLGAEYTVKFIDSNDRKNILDDRKGWAIIGSKVHIDPPEIPGYKYNAVKSVENEPWSEIKQYNNHIVLQYDKVVQGNYTLVCDLKSGSYTVKDASGDYTGYAEKPGNTELIRRVEYAPIGVSEWPSPVIEGYIPETPQYTVTIGQWYAPEVHIVYKPVDVELKIYAQYGDTVLTTTTLVGKYGSTIQLGSKKEIPGYIRRTESIVVPINNVGGVSCIFQYERDPKYAPFPPIGPVQEVELKKGEKVIDNPQMENFVMEVAKKFAEFFQNDWLTIGDNGEWIGYRTFTIANETYAIGGWYNLEKGSESDSLKSKIATATGIDEEHILCIRGEEFKIEHDDGKIKDDGMSILWDALITDVINSMDSPMKEQLLADKSYKKIEIEFEDRDNEEGRFDLEEVEIKFGNDAPESWENVKAEVKFKKQ